MHNFELTRLGRLILQDSNETPAVKLAKSASPVVGSAANGYTALPVNVAS